MTEAAPRQRAPGRRAARQRAPARRRALSLRTRLVAVAVTLVAFAVLATGAATYLALRPYLYDRFNDNLLSNAQSLASLIRPIPRPLGGTQGWGFDGYVSPDTLIAVLGTDSASAIPFTDTDGHAFNYLNLRPSDISRVLLSDHPVNVTTTDGKTMRVTHAQTRSRSGTDQLTLLVGMSTGDVSRTLGKLLGLEAIAAVIAVLGTAVLSAYGVQIGLRPLGRVTRTAHAVAAELGPDGTGLERRVPGGHPHTEVGQLANAVNTMLDAVEREYSARYESEQRMRRFLADASHELRTPLTSLRGYAELIRMRGGDGFDADARDSLRRIESEGTRMSRLVDDLLTLARHDRGVVAERKPVDLGAVAADAVAGLRAAHPEREVSLRAQVGITVLGDRDQLQQVVTNLLTNAAVHTRPDGPIAVSVDQRDGTATITIADAGPGLPPEQVAHMFERFWRADAARTRVRGGSGLGLPIVQALVKTHGGDVRVESSPEAGTAITVALPVAAPPGGARRPGRTAAALPAGDGVRVEVGDGVTTLRDPAVPARLLSAAAKQPTSDRAEAERAGEHQPERLPDIYQPERDRH